MPAWTVIYVWAFWPLLAVAVALCFWRGDRATRSASLVYGLGIAISTLLLSPRMFARVEWATAIADLILFVALTAVAVRWPRWWIVGLASLQLVSLLGHLSRIMIPYESRLAYAILTGSSSYPALILLFIAALPSRATSTISQSSLR